MKINNLLLRLPFHLRLHLPPIACTVGAIASLYGTPLLAQQNTTTGYGYDANGNLTTITDPNGKVTDRSFDALNRLLTTLQPPASVGGTRPSTTTIYNGQDRLTQITDPRALATSYSVDGLGNLTQQTSPDTGATLNTYDAAGNVLTRTDAKGQITSYAYDALNRVTQIIFHDGSTQTYAYDTGSNAVGRLTSISETNAASAVVSTLAYAYDLLGRVTSETCTLNSIAYVTGYQYTNGDLSGITYPSGKQLTYTLDPLGRINQVTLTSAGTTKILASNIQYHPFGGIKSYTNGAGQTLIRPIDLDGRIASYTLGPTSYQLGYDAASRITYQTDTGNAANTVSYGYDPLDRLTSATLPSTNLGYGYDANGNRTSQTIGAATYSYTVSPTSNQLSGINNVPPQSYNHDANGSITNDGTNSFSYDPRGRLTQATTAAGTTTYQLNAQGQRIRKTNATEDTLYHYDRGGHLIEESDPAGNPKRSYFYLHDLPLAVIQ